MAFTGVPSGPSPFAVAAVKGLEYACLGFIIGWLGQRSWAAVQHHAAAGLTAGILFDGILLAMTVAASSRHWGE